MPGSPGGHSTATQEDNPNVEQRRDYDGEDPLLVWTGLSPGDVVSLQEEGHREYLGSVEDKTDDGLIIWIRGELNERKLFHFRDCQSVRSIGPI